MQPYPKRSVPPPQPPPDDWPTGRIVAACAVAVAVLVAVLVFINRRPSAETVPPEAAASAVQAASAPAPKPPLPEGLLSGEIDAAVRGDVFTALPEGYASKTVYVHRNAHADLIRMMDAARQDGVHLQVLSGFRSYKHQKSIWERKWGELSGSRRERTLQVLRYSSFPGISRHHWGSDVDFNSVKPDYWLSEAGMKAHLWLRQNAARFGFCEPYSGNRNSGYANEAWHWSHRPSARTVAEASDGAHLNALLQHKVSGADTLKTDDLLPYISDIAAECLP